MQMMCNVTNTSNWFKNVLQIKRNINSRSQNVIFIFLYMTTFKDPFPLWKNVKVSFSLKCTKAVFRWVSHQHITEIRNLSMPDDTNECNLLNGQKPDTDCFLWVLCLYTWCIHVNLWWQPNVLQKRHPKHISCRTLLLPEPSFHAPSMNCTQDTYPANIFKGHWLFFHNYQQIEDDLS